MYWYLILDGKKLPTPYASLQEADEAMYELKAKLGPCIIDCVLE